ncbi:putative lipid II flippase FtsW [Treponema putidum]|uniref:Probable peptidoglycan glycosyltransferase FtsW n=1 Tax=Treponema putidum TaxID=221027 RepID=A0ABY5HU82_9SPIR|nr:putative lipid II flippase FtsW [Treponema putidum]AIN94922.1 cell division protein FtsW [Treponema putidum]TWI77081.1 cell division protein FtsW [Treponema putidum]UTY28941.1 putative lipid II flippase FtsW [Treponema putidum]
MVKHIIAKKNIRSEKYDFVFAMSVLLLFGVGFATLYSGSIYYAQRIFDNHLYFVTKQIKHFILGIIAMTFFLFADFSTIRKILPAIMFVTLIFCLLPFVPGIGEERNGALRWVNIAGFIFQPSELLKLSLILFLANFFDKKKGNYDQPLISVITPFIIMSFFALLVYLGNDFFGSIFILLIGVLMFFIAGVPLLWFVKAIVSFSPLVILMIVTKEYRMERILSFLDPSRNPLDSGFQIQASLNALTSGGFWGQGLGNGIRKIASVPEIYSDFIFVVWAEEMGFIGVIFYIALLAFFAFFGYRIAFGCKNRFGAYVSFGAVSCIIIQSLVNCAVVSRLLPATGIPLPFFSSGGSSLVVTFCLCGLVLNASGYVKKKEK